ncbi:MAG: type II secretion system F family protein [Ignavibacteria bacterium]|jgi:type IV pilus assembly protein PilC
MFNRITNKEIIELNRVLSLLLIARIPIISALELIARQTQNSKLKDLLKGIEKNLKAGNSLSKSFSKHPDIFSDIYISNLKIGEETGNIADVLTQYTDYQEKFFLLKKKISQASRYPVFILLVSISVIAFMMFFLIPTFESLFKSVKAKLPPVTEVLLSTSNFFLENSITVLITFMILFVIIRIASRSNYIKINFTDKFIIHLPYISDLFVKNLLARFSLSMSVLLKNGISLLEALKISKNISTNSVFRNEITSLVKKMIRGESMASNIGNSIFFDMTFTRLLAAGEESAELGKVFYLISDYYSKEFDYRLENIMSLAEPILILFIGSIVAVILIAMYLPMFEIINYVGV